MGGMHEDDRRTFRRFVVVLALCIVVDVALVWAVVSPWI